MGKIYVIPQSNITNNITQKVDYTHPSAYPIETKTKVVDGVDWTYTIWSNNMCECWGVSPKFTTQCTNPWGSLFANTTQTNGVPSYGYPVTFAYEPVVMVSPRVGEMNYWLHTGPNSNPTTRTPNYNVTRGTSGTVTANVQFIVKGYLKT